MIKINSKINIEEWENIQKIFEKESNEGKMSLADIKMHNKAIITVIVNIIGTD